MPSLDRRLFLKLASAAAASPRLLLQAEESTRILLPVNVCGSFGYVDGQGNLAVPARYEAALPFATDWAAVRRNGKWGYIDRSGRETLAPQYDEARNSTTTAAPSAWARNGTLSVRTVRKPSRSVSNSPGAFRTVERVFV